MPRFVERIASGACLAIAGIALLAGAKNGTRSIFDARIEELTARLATLERRMVVVEQAPSGSPALPATVKAPFVVTDAGGRPIFSVVADPRGIRIQDPAGKVVVLASAVQGGGFVKTLTADQGRVAVLGAVAGSAAIYLRDGLDNNRISITVGADGKPQFSLLNESKKEIIALGQTGTSGGHADFNDADGNILVTMSANPRGGVIKALTADQSRVAVVATDVGRAIVSLRDAPSTDRLTMTVGADGSPEFSLFNSSHTKVLALTHEAEGGGKLSLLNSAGGLSATVAALPSGGYFKAQTANQSRVALIGTETGNAFVTLRDGPSTPRATLAVTGDSKPALVLFNDQHINVFTLTQGARGDGMFQISDAAGKPMVEGGVLGTGIGMVRVGPGFNCSGKMGLLASDCIFGHKP